MDFKVTLINSRFQSSHETINIKDGSGEKVNMKTIHQDSFIFDKHKIY